MHRIRYAVSDQVAECEKKKRTKEE